MPNRSTATPSPLASRAAILVLVVALLSIGYMTIIEAGTPHRGGGVAERLAATLADLPDPHVLLEDARLFVRLAHERRPMEGLMLVGARFAVLLVGILPLMFLIYLATQHSDRDRS